MTSQIPPIPHLCRMSRKNNETNTVTSAALDSCFTLDSWRPIMSYAERSRRRWRSRRRRSAAPVLDLGPGTFRGSPPPAAAELDPRAVLCGNSVTACGSKMTTQLDGAEGHALDERLRVTVLGMLPTQERSTELV